MCQLIGLVSSMFLKKEMGSYLEKGRKLVDGEAGDGVLKARVKTAQQRGDEVRFRDTRTQITQLIRELLDLCAVLHHGHVALIDVEKFGAEVDGSGGGVVAEETPDGAPQGVRRVAASLHGAKQIGGDGAVEPRDDGVIVLHPVRRSLGSSGVDVVEEAELGEDCEKAQPPWPIVGVVEVQNHGHMGLDVDELDLGSRGRSCLDFGNIPFRRGGRRTRGGGRVGGRTHGAEKKERVRKRKIVILLIPCRR